MHKLNIGFQWMQTQDSKANPFVIEHMKQTRRKLYYKQSIKKSDPALQLVM